MKLLRYGKEGEEKINIEIAGKKYDVSAFGGDYDERFFASDGLARLAQYIENNAGNLEEIPADSRLAAPFARPSKIVCIGLNYRDHAEETGAAIPQEPIIFMKSTTALVGPHDDVIIPKNSVKTDWEVEFGIVIGKKATYVEEANALDHVAGYVLHNDVSEREFQIERGGTWDKGKGCDTFAPMGPWIATPDEISDVNNLGMWLSFNGKKVQDGNSSNLIFKIPFLIHYLSQFMTLEPGDIISTGTPAGVGLGMDPPTYLKPGDVMELGVNGLGVSKQSVKAYQKA